MTGLGRDGGVRGGEGGCWLDNYLVEGQCT